LDLVYTFFSPFFCSLILVPIFSPTDYFRSSHL
jgi:hypothetical protein